MMTMEQLAALYNAARKTLAGEITWRVSPAHERLFFSDKNSIFIGPKSVVFSERDGGGNDVVSFSIDEKSLHYATALVLCEEVNSQTN